jgi:hypothetical protein
MRFPFICVATVCLAATAAPQAATADGVKIGGLSCKVDAGLGLVIASQRDMKCLFVSENGAKETYAGIINKFGLDIGKTEAGVLEWAVFAPAGGPPKGALAGDYIGAGASVTIGAGVGVNALVGGFNRSFTLQPLSVQTQTGLDLAGGVTELTLRAGR